MPVMVSSNFLASLWVSVIYLLQITRAPLQPALVTASAIIKIAYQLAAGGVNIIPSRLTYGGVNAASLYICLKLLYRLRFGTEIICQWKRIKRNQVQFTGNIAQKRH